MFKCELCGEDCGSISRYLYLHYRYDHDYSHQEAFDTVGRQINEIPDEVYEKNRFDKKPDSM